MSVEAKVRFINNMKARLSKVLTADDLEEVLTLMADEASRYEIESKEVIEYTQDDMLKAYLDALKIEGRSPKTIERYNYIIGKMLKATKIPTREITVYDIRSYLASEKERGLADKTIEGMRQIFSGYFGWLHREGIIKINPVANIGAIKCKKKIRLAYSNIDIENIKRACTSPRDLAIVMFLLSTGCRVSEIVNLNRDDVDLITLECKVLGKGNKERIVYLDEVTGMYLDYYLKSRSDDNEALFLNRFGDRLGAGGIRNMLKGIEESTGIENIHPHRFRRTLATNLIHHGMPIEEVATILGHDKLDTTMKYIVLDKSDVKHAYQRFK